MALVHHPRRFAAQRPDHPAIVMAGSGHVVDYATLEDAADRFAQVLRGAGVGIGDHVALMLDNRAEYLELVWGAQRAGVYYTAINRHLRSGEVQYILDDCGARLVVVSPSVADVAAELDRSCIATWFCVGGDVAGCDPLEPALEAAPSGPIPDEREGREMLYSSGTTGRPKGILRPLPEGPLGDPSSDATRHVPAYQLRGIGADSVYLCPAPLYHAAPLTACVNVHRLGGTVVVMERFDAELFLATVERQNVTDTEMVPTMFVRLLRLPEEVRARYDLSSLRNVVHAAAPCPIEVKRQMIEWFGPIIDEYYSGSEDIGHTFITSNEWLAHPGSVGRPLCETHIVGPDGVEVPTGEEGVVYMVGGNVFEYHNDPEKTASVFNERGWRTIGDIGRLDADGYLYLTDRQSNMIIAGGVNIYPQEAENVLLGHPDVLDVAVIGVPNPDLGEEVKAVVQLTDPSRAGDETAEALLAYCHEHLAPYKCPRSVDFVERLPREDNGKLYKRLLRERYWAGHATRIV